MTTTQPCRIAVLWAGDRAARSSATPHNNRYKQIFDELAALGIQAEPAVYADDMASEVREQLLRVDGVLVWVDPIFDGGNRAVLDAMLRDVAAKGIWVSAPSRRDPKNGHKRNSPQDRSISVGGQIRTLSNSQRISGRVSVGTWFIRAARSQTKSREWRAGRLEGGASIYSTDRVRVLQAIRGGMPEELPLADFMKRCDAYLEGDGCIVDQPFQPRLFNGMIRCYMRTGKVVRFGHQFIKALVTPPANRPPPEPRPRIMHEATATSPVRRLRRRWKRNGCRR